jgi:type I restriction enzyme M protein
MKKPVQPSLTTRKAVFNLFDCVRGQVSSDNYTVVPALLIISREPGFQRLLKEWAALPGDAMRDTELFDRASDGSHLVAVRSYVQLFVEFQAGIKQRLLEGIRSIDLHSLSQDEFEGLFDYALEFCLQIESRKSGQWGGLPPEVLELVAGIADIQPGERIFNPNAGTAPLVSWLDSSVEYVAMEEAEDIRELAKLRLIAHGRSTESVLAGTVTGQWSHISYWDVVCCPQPILPRRTFSNASSRPSAAAVNVQTDVYTIAQALQCLKEGGRAVIAVSPNFLFRTDRNTVQFRKQLLEQDILESVIQLPAGLLLPYASIPFALLTFQVNKRRRGEVLFIGAEQYAVAGRDLRRTLLVEGVLNASRRPEDNTHARYISHEEIAAGEYNFNVRRYLTQVEAHPDDVDFGEIASPIKKSRVLPSQIGRYVSIRHLQGETSNFEPNWYKLKWTDIEAEPIEKSASSLSEDALLIATQFGSLKPTWFKHDSNAKLLISPSIIALQLDLSRVDVEYLVTELNSEHVLQQLKNMQVGSTITSLPRQALLKLQIRLPKELSQQRAIVDGIREQLAKQKQKEVDALRANIAQKAENVQQFATMKHALGGPLMRMESGLARLERVITRYSQDNLVLTFDSLMNPADPNVTVGHTLTALKQAQQFIFDTLDRNEERLVVEKYPQKLVELIGFLREFVASSNATYRTFTTTFEGSFELMLAEVVADEKATHWVLANETLLQRAFENILENANRHGFQNQKAGRNRVAIEASFGYFDDNVAPNINIFVRNNGASFPLNFNPEQLFQKGEYAGDTGRSGIGGHEVREIFNYFGGSVEAYGMPDGEDFTVTYAINLPLSEAENTAPDAEDL